MKFLLDENEMSAFLPTLRFIYPKLTFDAAAEVNLDGLKDLELIPEMSQRGYVGLITRDKNQLDNPEERRSLLHNNVHWIGHKSPPGVGSEAVTSLTAAYVAAFPHILAKLRGHQDALCFRVSHLPANANQRVKVSKLAF